jgi:antirestriction protein ArdC
MGVTVLPNQLVPSGWDPKRKSLAHRLRLSFFEGCTVQPEFAGASNYLHFFGLKNSLVGRTQNTGLFGGLMAKPQVRTKSIGTKVTDDGEESTKTFPLLRYFTLFNLEQVEGENLEHLWVSNGSNSSPLCADYEPAQKAVEACGAEIRFGGDQAYYLRPIGQWPNHSGGDYICLPHSNRFTSPNEYFSTCFHELVHWSEVRLDWTGSYPLGELIAEIGGCYIASHVGNPVSGDLSNHAAYVARWLKELEGDPKAIMKAATQASKATEFILSFSRQHEAQGAEAA